MRFFDRDRRTAKTMTSTMPTCPKCGATELERAVSRIAPAGKIEAIRASNRRQAAREGHFSNFSAAERAKLTK